MLYQQKYLGKSKVQTNILFWLELHCFFSTILVEKPIKTSKHFQVVRVSIVEFIVGNTVEFVNVTMNMTMNLTNSDKVSETNNKKKVLAPSGN